MNGTYNHESRYPDPGDAYYDNLELSALRRENSDLQRELLEAEVGLRNAVQYALMVHFHQQWPHCGAPSRYQAVPSTESGGRGTPGRPEGPELTRLRMELEQARAELAQLHRLVAAIPGKDGHRRPQAGEEPGERSFAIGIQWALESRHHSGGPAAPQ
jgi:hypothetical protein